MVFAVLELESMHVALTLSFKLINFKHLLWISVTRLSSVTHVNDVTLLMPVLSSCFLQNRLSTRLGGLHYNNEVGALEPGHHAT